MRSGLSAVTISSVIKSGASIGVGIFLLIVPIIVNQPSPKRNMFLVVVLRMEEWDI